MILRDKRKRLGYSLEELVKKSELTYGALQRYEICVRYPRPSEIMKIARLYELTNEEIIEWLIEMENN